jgi:hypothetical protein
LVVFDEFDELPIGVFDLEMERHGSGQELVVPVSDACWTQARLEMSRQEPRGWQRDGDEFQP